MAAAVNMYCGHGCGSQNVNGAFVAGTMASTTANSCPNNGGNGHNMIPIPAQNGVFIPADAKVKIGSHAASRATDGTVERVAEFWQFSIGNVTQSQSGLVIGNSFQDFHWENRSEASHQRVCERAWDGVLGNVQGCVMYGANKFVGNQDIVDEKERKEHDTKAQLLEAILTIPQAQGAYEKFKLWGKTTANPDMIVCSNNNNANFSAQNAMRRLRCVVDWKKRTQPRKNTSHSQARMQLIMVDLKWNECGGAGNNNNNGPLVFHTTMIDNTDEQAVTHAYYFANQANGIELKTVNVSCDTMIYWIKRLFGANQDNRYPNLPNRVSAAYAFLARNG